MESSLCSLVEFCNDVLRIARLAPELRRATHRRDGAQSASFAFEKKKRGKKMVNKGSSKNQHPGMHRKGVLQIMFKYTRGKISGRTGLELVSELMIRAGGRKVDDHYHYSVSTIYWTLNRGLFLPSNSYITVLDF